MLHFKKLLQSANKATSVTAMNVSKGQLKSLRPRVADAFKKLGGVLQVNCVNGILQILNDALPDFLSWRVYVFAT